MPEGITLDVESPIRLEGHQTEEVEGNLRLSNALSDGEYEATIRIVMDGETAQILPLTVTLNKNLLSNPGFETGVNSPDRWELRAGKRVQDIVYSGQYAVTLLPDSDNTWNVINSSGINIELGKTYKLSGWVKNDSEAGGVYIGARKIDANGNTINPYHWKQAKPNSDWTRYELEFNTTANTNRISVYLRVDQQAEGQAWFDDFRLEEVVEE